MLTIFEKCAVKIITSKKKIPAINLRDFSSTSTQYKTGILFLNMGGPETQDDVYSFLLNLFSDKEIISLPFQSVLSQFIAKRRTPTIKEHYKQIGGGTQLKHWSQLQNTLLCQMLDEVSPLTAPHKPYLAFRYTNPMAANTLKEIIDDNIERVIVFSQYPQYSCTTSGSSLNELYKSIKEVEKAKDIKWSVIDRWGSNSLYTKAVAESIEEKLNSNYTKEERDNVILLFSAHSLPLYVVARGDAYPQEVAASVEHVMKHLNYRNPYRLTWQSKVGPLPWIRPSTLEVLKGLSLKKKNNIMFIPIAFTSDHIETLYELDIEYQKEAQNLGITNLCRSESMNARPLFIKALSNIVLEHISNNYAVHSQFLLPCPMCTNPKCKPTKTFFNKSCV